MPGVGSWEQIEEDGIEEMVQWLEHSVLAQDPGSSPSIYMMADFRGFSARTLRAPSPVAMGLVGG